MLKENWIQNLLAVRTNFSSKWRQLLILPILAYFLHLFSWHRAYSHAKVQFVWVAVSSIFVCHNHFTQLTKCSVSSHLISSHGTQHMNNLVELMCLILFVCLEIYSNILICYVWEQSTMKENNHPKGVKRGKLQYLRDIWLLYFNAIHATLGS